MNTKKALILAQADPCDSWGVLKVFEDVIAIRQLAEKQPTERSSANLFPFVIRRLLRCHPLRFAPAVRLLAITYSFDFLDTLFE